jgi:N-acetylmuramoyl-L-alanine amidase
MLRKLKIGFAVLTLAISGLVSFAQNNNFDIKTIVLDPGHGGKDPGAHYGNVKEKDIVLKVALMTGRLINQQFPDVKVIYTRDKDIFPALYERAEIANKNKADLFISIHANANKNPAAYGTETYIIGQHKSEESLKVVQAENSVILQEDDYTTHYEGFDPNSPESYIMFELIQNEHLEQSRVLANYVETNFAKVAKRKSKGVKQAGFLVLWKTAMPSILIELGFISNPNEQEFLLKKENQELMAQCIANSFAAYKTKYGAKNGSTTTAQKTTIETKKETPENKTTNTDGKITPIEALNADSAFYAIQIAASPVQLASDFYLFNKFDKVYIYTENNLYKYYFGIEKDHQIFTEKLKEVRLTVKDAFPVVFRNGKKEKFQKLNF